MSAIDNCCRTPFGEALGGTFAQVYLAILIMA